jgi:cardiolipin synthase
LLNVTQQPAEGIGEAGRQRSRSMFQQMLSVPNQLTMVRMLLVPFMLIAMLYRRHDLALWLFVAAACTDGIDGLIARRFNLKTLLGQYLDPIADKLFLSSAFLMQAFIGVIPWWLTILVLSRDVLIVAAALVTALATTFRDFRPSAYGKVNTACQVATIFIVLCNNATGQRWLQGPASLLMWITAGTTLLSAVHYGVEYSRRIHEHLGGNRHPAGPA